MTPGLFYVAGQSGSLTLNVTGTAGAPIDDSALELDHFRVDSNSNDEVGCVSFFGIFFQNIL